MLQKKFCQRCLWEVSFGTWRWDPKEEERWRAGVMLCMGLMHKDDNSISINEPPPKTCFYLFEQSVGFVE